MSLPMRSELFPWLILLLMGALPLAKNHAGETDSEIGSNLFKLRMEVRVREALRLDSELGKRNLHIRFQSGTITLSGQVPNEAMSRLAAETVQRVPGVYGVHNQLIIKPDPITITIPLVPEGPSSNQAAYTGPKREVPRPAEPSTPVVVAQPKPTSPAQLIPGRLVANPEEKPDTKPDSKPDSKPEENDPPKEKKEEKKPDPPAESPGAQSRESITAAIQEVWRSQPGFRKVQIYHQNNTVWLRCLQNQGADAMALAVALKNKKLVTTVVIQYLPPPPNP